jgi:hypothetical protein
VFAKEFEFHLFLVQVTSVLGRLVGYIERDGWIVLKFKPAQNINDDPISILCTVIKDSDIGFLLKCLDLISTLGARGHRVSLSMIGTCGGNENMDYQSVYQVTEVCKFDRGKLLEVQYKTKGKKKKVKGLRFERRVDKELYASVNPSSRLDPKILKPILAHSSNLLMEAPPQVLGLCSYDLIGFDMESYDFTEVCHRRQCQVGFILRVCSDQCTENAKGKRIKCRFTGITHDVLDALLPSLKTSERALSEATSVPFHDVATVSFATVKYALRDSLRFLMSSPGRSDTKYFSAADAKETYFRFCERNQDDRTTLDLFMGGLFETTEENDEIGKYADIVIKGISNARFAVDCANGLQPDDDPETWMSPDEVEAHELGIEQAEKFAREYQRELAKEYSKSFKMAGISDPRRTEGLGEGREGGGSGNDAVVERHG